MKKEDFFNKYFLLALILLVLHGCKPENEVCINKLCYKVLILDTPEERQLGLMNVDKLSNDNGAFFIFEKEDKHSFWMKNVEYPIDVIWIDENQTVVHVVYNAEPCNNKCEIHSPNEKALYVLEVNINSDIKIGDHVDIKWL